MGQVSHLCNGDIDSAFFQRHTNPVANKGSVQDLVSSYIFIITYYVWPSERKSSGHRKSGVSSIHLVGDHYCYFLQLLLSLKNRYHALCLNQHRHSSKGHFNNRVSSYCIIVTL